MAHSIALGVQKSSGNLETNKVGILKILLELKSRFSLKINLWLIIASKILPKHWRSPKQKKLFKLIDKS